MVEIAARQSGEEISCKCREPVRKRAAQVRAVHRMALARTGMGDLCLRPLKGSPLPKLANFGTQATLREQARSPFFCPS